MAVEKRFIYEVNLILIVSKHNFQILHVYIIQNISFKLWKWLKHQRVDYKNIKWQIIKINNIFCYCFNGDVGTGRSVVSFVLVYYTMLLGLDSRWEQNNVLFLWLYSPHKAMVKVSDVKVQILLFYILVACRGNVGQTALI